MLSNFVFIGVIVQMWGIFSYVKETLKGNTKPNRVSWLMWSIAPLIATSAALVDGVRLAVLPVFMSGFGPLLVFLVSFINKKSYWKLGKFDYLCGLFSALALILWAITKEPVIAIMFAIASDGLAAIPTLTKAWSHPETETVDIYAAGLFGALTGFFAIKTWSFSSYGFSIYLAIINIFLIVSIYRLKFLSFAKD